MHYRIAGFSGRFVLKLFSDSCGGPGVRLRKSLPATPERRPESVKEVRRYDQLIKIEMAVVGYLPRPEMEACPVNPCS
jgi:hypothetical protein